MGDSETAQSYSQYSAPQMYVDSSVMMMRIDTREMLDRIEAFLKGQNVVGYVEEPGRGLVPQYRTVGAPLCNDLGVHSIMGFLHSVVGPHTVQGTFKDYDEWDEFMMWLDIDFSKDVMTNLRAWGISESNYDYLCNTIKVECGRFFSRSIGNKERESYNNTMQSREMSVSRASGLGGFLGWNKK